MSVICHRVILQKKLRLRLCYSKLNIIETSSSFPKTSATFQIVFTNYKCSENKRQLFKVILSDIRKKKSFTADEDVVSVINIESVDSFFSFDDEIDVFDMASLSNFVLLGNTLNNSNDDCQNSSSQEDYTLQRLSLAYEKLHRIPKVLLQEIAPVVEILDISHNEFDNLNFLSEFKSLTSLICDHNKITSNTIIPYIPKLELLWLNHCKISSLYPWAKKLQLSCPNLKYLSLMGNPVAPSYLNGGNFYEYLQYRFFIISLFPKLIHLDDRPVTSDQRKEAERMYRKPLVERLVMKTQSTLPDYLRHISDVVSEILTPTPSFAAPEKNVII